MCPALTSYVSDELVLSGFSLRPNGRECSAQGEALARRLFDDDVLNGRENRDSRGPSGRRVSSTPTQGCALG
jgi:hypothetical protein